MGVRDISTEPVFAGLSQIFPRKRPFIIGRRTFLGSGTVSGH